jgi:hypothetical protein
MEAACQMKMKVHFTFSFIAGPARASLAARIRALDEALRVALALG